MGVEDVSPGVRVIRVIGTCMGIIMKGSLLQSENEKKKINLYTYNLIHTSQGFILNNTLLTDLQNHNNSHYFCRNRAQMPRRKRIRSPVQLPPRPA